MIDKDSELGRLGALSDGIFAVIITIMVLALRPPAHQDLKALSELWPDLISYVVSYFFIAVVWLNHHFVFRYANRLTSRLAWANFANLFWISLIPFTTAWLAVSRLASLPLTAYGIVFLLVELTYMFLMHESFRQGAISGHTPRSTRLQWTRAWVMLGLFGFATSALFIPPPWRMGLLAAFLVLHIRPEPRQEST